MSRIIVVGSYNVGLTVISPELPQPGQTVLGHTLDVGPGGKGSNQAIGARRLEADVTLVCKLGNDRFSDDAVALFEKEGLAGPGILSAETYTGTGLILVDDSGANMISVAPGANAQLKATDLDAIHDLFNDGGYLLCQLEAPAELFLGAAQRARAAGMTTVLNPAPAVPLDHAILSWIDILTPNESELATLTGMPTDNDAAVEAAARSLLADGVGEVVVTLGERGGIRVAGDVTQPFAAHPVTAVDTTGCGDAFNAGFVAGLAMGDDPSAALDLGARAGAYCATRIGVIDGLPTRTQLDMKIPA